jgi:hypothetical protein
MARIAVSPALIIGRLDTKTGEVRPTAEFFRLLGLLSQELSDETSEVARTDAEQTLTNKTIDGDSNTLRDIATSSLKNTTGDDTDVVTGTAGGSDMPAKWGADGNLVEMPDDEFADKVSVVIDPRAAGTAQEFVANDTTATVMSNVGPVGANTAIQGWIKITKVDGTFGYVPHW